MPGRVRLTGRLALDVEVLTLHAAAGRAIAASAAARTPACTGPGRHGRPGRGAGAVVQPNPAGSLRACAASASGGAPWHTARGAGELREHPAPAVGRPRAHLLDHPCLRRGLRAMGQPPHPWWAWAYFWGAPRPCRRPIGDCCLVALTTWTPAWRRVAEQTVADFTALSLDQLTDVLADLAASLGASHQRAVSDPFNEPAPALPRDVARSIGQRRNPVQRP